MITHVIESGVRAAVRRVAPVVEAEDLSAGITLERKEIYDGRCCGRDQHHDGGAAEVKSGQEDQCCTRLTVSSGTHTWQYPTALTLSTSLLPAAVHLSGNLSRSSTAQPTF